MSIESLTAELLMNETAGRYATLIADTSPAALAEKYAQVISHQDPDSMAMAMAIEWHIRTLATTHFHVNQVSQALQKMERLKESARKHRAANRRRAARARVKSKAKRSN